MDGVDDHDVDRAASGFELQSELILQRGEQLAHVIKCRELRCRHQFASGGPAQREVERAAQLRPVQDRRLDFCGACPLQSTSDR